MVDRSRQKDVGVVRVIPRWNWSLIYVHRVCVLSHTAKTTAIAIGATSKGAWLVG